MTLNDYRRKRHFSKTPEPTGKAPGRPTSGSAKFVVQKHAARRLHYDFRLEMDGVLKSWAVPKGPCLDPAEKRLAVLVEDHPLEYGDFEGSIPKGEYGGGTVIVWDHGAWFPEEPDPVSAFRDGMLKFRLEGEKLRGRWMLVRMKPRSGEKDVNWLLVKERDAEARSLAEFDILDERPDSAASGKTIDEVAAGTTRVWSSRAKAAVKTTSRSGTSKSLPVFSPPQLAVAAETPPEGSRWLHEIKFDGYRLLAYVDNGQVVLRTRSGLDWTNRFPELAEAVAAVPVRQAIFDGEVVALLPNGASSFPELQAKLSGGETGQLVYFIFDLLFVDEQDLRSTPLVERKRRLEEIIAATGKKRLHYVDHLVGNGAEFLKQCRELGLEGVVSKRGDRPSVSGRTDDWIKVKCVQRDEFVIGGFTTSTATRRGVRALLIGTFDPAGGLIYTGKVGSGFTEESLGALRERLMARQQKENPFANLPSRDVDRGTRWVRPELVAQVQYANRSHDGVLRHAVFLGLRDDIAANEVVTRDSAAAGAQEKKPRTWARSAAGVGSETPPAADLQPHQLSGLEGVRFTNPERVLYPESGITKLGLASFYAEISDWILPQLKDRLISLVRCPDGLNGAQFFQKHVASGTPEAVHRIPVTENGATVEFLMVDDLAGLISLVQISILEIHTWGSKVDDIERPDRIVFDLDPDPTVPWPKVIEAAREVRSRLVDLKLESFVKTTGGKGLHVVVPIQRRHGWDEVKEFAKRFAARMASDAPSNYTATMAKAARRGKIYLDFFRNSRGATAVAPYSTRARPGAPVSTPLAWDELTPAIRSDDFHIGNLRDRLASLQSDPWAEIGSTRQSLTAAVRRKLGL